MNVRLLAQVLPEPPKMPLPPEPIYEPHELLQLTLQRYKRTWKMTANAESQVNDSNFYPNFAISFKYAVLFWLH